MRADKSSKMWKGVCKEVEGTERMKETATQIGVKTMSLVSAVSYDNKQIDIEKWEPG